MQRMRGDRAEPRQMQRRADAGDIVGGQGEVLVGDDAYAAPARDAYAARAVDAARRCHRAESQVERRRPHARLVETGDIDDLVLDCAHDLVVDEHARARCALRARLRRRERVLQPVVGAAAGEASKLRRHRAGNRLAAVDDVVDRLPRYAGRLADVDLIETELLELRAQVLASLQRAAASAAVPSLRRHRPPPCNGRRGTPAAKPRAFLQPEAEAEKAGGGLSSRLVYANHKRYKVKSGRSEYAER